MRSSTAKPKKPHRKCLAFDAALPFRFIVMIDMFMMFSAWIEPRSIREPRLINVSIALM